MKALLALVSLVLFAALVMGSRHFEAQGTGMGNSLWKNGSIPYIINVTKDKNKVHVASTLRKAAAVIRKLTCVNFFEVTPETWKGNYVNVRDTVEGSCSAGGAVLNYDGCGGQVLVVIHEMMHILGIGHEQQRFDSYNKMKLIEANIQPDFLNQYDARLNEAHGEYDFNSLMYYGNYGFSTGPGPTYLATRTDLPTKCETMSPGDIATVNFVTQQCYAEPMRPRCRTSTEAITIGRRFDRNISFVGLYKTERLLVNFSGLPEGAVVRQHRTNFGAVHMVELRPTTRDVGNVFDITATFRTQSDGQMTSCTTKVTVVDADYVCDGVASNSPNVCSGHGTCSSNVYPQCTCETGYDGAFCEGVASCPSDVAVDFEKDVEGMCQIPVDHEDLTRVQSPDGFAANGTEVYTEFMQRIVRRPAEVSFLLNVLGVGDVNMWISGGNILFNSIRSFRIGGVTLASWSLFQFVFDWQRLSYVHYVNGRWAANGTIASPSKCASSDSLECTVNSLTIKGVTNQTTVQVDRIRALCSARHVTASTDRPLSAVTLLTSPIRLRLAAPLSTYTWQQSTLADLCTATDNAILEGAVFEIDSARKNLLTVTLQPSTTRQLPAADQYLVCHPKSKHFTAAGARRLAAEVDANGWRVLAVSGLCNEGDSYAYPNVRNRAFSQNPTVAARPSQISTTFGFRADSDWEMRIRRLLPSGATQEAIWVTFVASSNRITFGNGTTTRRLTDGRVSQATEITATVAFDWTAKTMNLRVFGNVSETLPFAADALATAGVWYWAGSPNGTITFNYACPTVTKPSVPVLYAKTSTTSPSTPSTPGTVPGTPSTPTPPSGGSPSGVGSPLLSSTAAVSIFILIVLISTL